MMGVAAVQDLRSDLTQNRFPCYNHHHLRLFPTSCHTENSVASTIPSLYTACHEGLQLLFSVRPGRFHSSKLFR